MAYCKTFAVVGITIEKLFLPNKQKKKMPLSLARGKAHWFQILFELLFFSLNEFEPIKYGYEYGMRI